MADPKGRRRTPQVLTAAVLVVLATVAWVVGSASLAAAHDALRASSPADGSTVATLPADVVLTFDQPALALGTEVVVTDPAGSPVQEGAPSLVDATVRQRVRGGPAGTYAVRWRVTSVDGHPVSGTFTFITTTAASASTLASSSASSSTSTSASTAASTAAASNGVVAAPAPAPTSSSTSVVPVVVALLALLVAGAAGGALVRARGRGRRG